MRRLLSITVLLGVIAAGGASWALDSCVVPTGQTYTINEHSTCRRVTNSHASGQSIMVPTKTAAEWSSGGNAFINATPPGVTISNCAACGDTNNCGPSGGGGAGSGSQSFTTAGSFNFVVPCYNTLTVEVWGGGGGAVGRINTSFTTDNTSGGDSSWNGTQIVAYGGNKSTGGFASTTAFGAGGSASGGTTNLTGQDGQNGLTNSSGAGGAGANGGAGGPAMSSGGVNSGQPGTAPGGGGSGVNYNGRTRANGSGAGGGGYASRVFSAGQISVGASIPVVVGAGGLGGVGNCGSCNGGAGAPGRVTITWN